MTEEIFKPIPGHEKYLVSNYGNVFSTVSSKILKTAKNPAGYVHTNIGSWRTVDIHAIVMLAFVGPRPEGMSDINHKNGDKADNRLENLEYCTKSHNCIHSYKVIGRTPSIDCVGELNHGAKLTEQQVMEIFNERLKSGRRTQRELADAYGVGKATIARIQTGKYWSHLAKPPAGTTFDRGSVIRGIKHPRTKLSELDVIEIFLESRKDKPRRQRNLAAHFGITKSAITHIQQGRCWSHITNNL